MNVVDGQALVLAQRLAIRSTRVLPRINTTFSKTCSDTYQSNEPNFNGTASTPFVPQRVPPYVNHLDLLGSANAPAITGNYFAYRQEN